MVLAVPMVLQWPTEGVLFYRISRGQKNQKGELEVEQNFQNIPGRYHLYQSVIINLTCRVHVSGFPQDRSRPNLVARPKQAAIEHRSNVETDGWNVLLANTHQRVQKRYNSKGLTMVAAAIRKAGVVLSQPVKRTTPSRG